MAEPKGPTGWAVLRLRNEASLLREWRRDVEWRGLRPHQLKGLTDAAAAADRMAHDALVGDRRALRTHWREYDKAVAMAGPSAMPLGRRAGSTPVDQTAARWELDTDAETDSQGSDDLRRTRETHHRVRGFEREGEGRRERVRPHLARNPRKK